jgi:hypothetical protein
MSRFPRVIERRFQHRQNSIGRRSTFANAISGPIRFPMVWPATGLAASEGGLLGKTLMPVLDPPCGQLADLKRAEWRQDVGLGGSTCVVDRLASAPAQVLQVIRDGVSDRERPRPRVVAILAPQLRSPPNARGTLGLAVIQHSHPVSFLEIVSSANPMLDIAAAVGPSPRKPCAALAAPPIAECKTFFEPAPVRLCEDWQPKASGACFQICVADRACHFCSFMVGEFLGSIRGQMAVYGGGHGLQEVWSGWAQLLFAKIRPSPGIDPLTAKTRVRVP